MKMKMSTRHGKENMCGEFPRRCRRVDHVNFI